MVWLLEVEPDKVQMHYLLGFLNWKIKGDLIQAREDFGRFLANERSNNFLKERSLAEDWLEELSIAEQPA